MGILKSNRQFSQSKALALALLKQLALATAKAEAELLASCLHTNLALTFGRQLLTQVRASNQR